MTETLIPHSRPTLPTGDEWSDVTRRLHPGWIADGPCTAHFERELAQWLGGAAAVAVNSGSNALHLALLGVGVRPGASVLIPCYACAAVANAVLQAGAVPRFYDVEPGGIAPDPADARRRWSTDVSAVVAIHPFGRPVDVEALAELGPVVEDCAQALGARWKGNRVGGAGAAAIGSFFATKVITTGHGGVVASRSAAVIDTCRDLLTYDNRDDLQPRFNDRISELQAALGLWQLERLPGWLARRRTLADYYDGEFLGAGWSRASLRGLREAAGDPDETDAGAICYRYVLRVPDAGEAITRLAAHGVSSRRPVHRPLHMQAGLEAAEYPHAWRAHDEIISLPLYPSLSDEEVEGVVQAVKRSLQPTV